MKEDGHSSEDEGFKPNSITVEKVKKGKETVGLKESPKDKYRPRDMQTRYICGSGIIKKEPTEMHMPISDIRERQEEYKFNRMKRPRGRTEMTAAELYFRSKQYRLVYGRIVERFEGRGDDSFTNIYVNLDNAIDYDQNGYSLLKTFDGQVKMLQEQSNDDLIFDSRFECGNLAYAFRRHDTLLHEYDLFMQSDTNTVGYCQWFNFALRNMRKNIEYRFNIVNFRKRTSLFSEGMKPVVFSLKKAQETGSGWSKNARYISYYRSRFAGNDCERSRLHTLSFSLIFYQDKDYVTVSMALPYSYSKLMKFLNEEKQKQRKDVILNIDTIGYSLSNNIVPMLNVSTEGENKKIIVITARQHPGYTWSSYLMEGFIRILLNSESKEIVELRKSYTFVIIPMINIDGVIYGNFRCDLSGCDLNRQWQNPSKCMHPHICAIKSHLYKLSSQTYIFIDLHGHSKKMNTFCYSCKDEDPYSCRVLPILISKFEQAFSLPDCTFGIDRWKENTARAFMFYASRRVNMLTIECSFYGSNKNYEKKPKAFQPSQMDGYASNILKAVAVYSGQEIDDIKKSEIEKETIMRAKYFYEYDQKNEFDSGSDSDPYGDELEEKEKIGRVYTQRVMAVVNSSKINENPPIRFQKPREKKYKVYKKVNKPRVNKSQHNSTAIPRLSHEIIESVPTIEPIQGTTRISKLSPIKDILNYKRDRSDRMFQASALRKKSPAYPSYILQHSTYIPLHLYYERIRLTELAKRRYHAYGSLRQSTSSSESITTKRRKRYSTKMPRVAIMNESIEKTMEKNHPVLVILSDKKKQVLNNRQLEYKMYWNGNNLFPIRKKEKVSGSVITYEKFRQKSYKYRNNLVHITKFWRENVDKYTKEQRYQMLRENS